MGVRIEWEDRRGWYRWRLCGIQSRVQWWLYCGKAMLFLTGIPTLACAGALHTSYSFTLQTLWFSTSGTQCCPWCGGGSFVIKTNTKMVPTYPGHTKMVPTYPGHTKMVPTYPGHTKMVPTYPGHFFQKRCTELNFSPPPLPRVKDLQGRASAGLFTRMTVTVRTTTA